MKCIIEVSSSEFRSWFRSSQYENNFTYEQLGLLYEHLDSIEDENGFCPYNDDITEIACTYSGYNEAELLEEYATEDMFELDDVLDYLEQQTEIIYDSDKINFIVRDF